MSDEPKPIKVQSSGEVTRRENKDGSLSLSSKHPVALHLESIKSIGIENLVDVEVHSINSVFNSVSHYIRFFGGGEVRFSFNADGEVLQFEASKVDAFIANGESIILKRQREAAKPSA